MLMLAFLATAAAQAQPVLAPPPSPLEADDGIPSILLPPPAPLVVPPPLLVAPPKPGLPDSVRTMLQAAYKTGDDKTIAAVVGLAKANLPAYIDEINALSASEATRLATMRRDEQTREQERILAARFFQIWKGEVEAGGSRSTGSTQALGVYASANLTRDGVKWRQKFNGRIDYQQTDHVTTTERWLAAWQPSYKLRDDLYVFALGQYEHDRFLGYSSRETVGTGLGYTPISRPDFTVELEGGPAFRHTNFIGLPTRDTLAGRASVNLIVPISPTLAFKEQGSVFVEAGDATATSTTSVDTKLIGDLKARFSYNIQFERETPMSARQLDTITRATLVYSF